MLVNDESPRASSRYCLSCAPVMKAACTGADNAKSSGIRIRTGMALLSRQTQTPRTRRGVFAFKENQLALETLAHELLALVAFEVLGARVGVAGFHFLLLRRELFLLRGGRPLGGQALAHELLALVAFQRLGAGLGVARFHFLLLRRVSEHR